MPVTRSANRPASQQPSNPPYTLRSAGSSVEGTKKSTHPSSNEIIVLSSDDDEPPPKGTVSPKKSSHHPRKKTATFAAPPVPSNNVLEISSDDESRPKKTSSRKRTSSSESVNKDLHYTIKRLREDLKQTEQCLTSTSRELEELKHDAAKDLFSGLTEYTVCEVCTHTMWCPYTLPECGHSFCQACLSSWFSKTQVQHLTTNPQLENSRAALAGQLRAFVQLVPNLHAYGLHGQQHVRAVLTELRRHRPEYTCPSCRKEVLNKPVEDYRLKGLIKEIAGMMGEQNSCKDGSRHRGSGPFDHFFAAPIAAS